MRTLGFVACFFNAALLSPWLAEEAAAQISAPDVVTAVEGGTVKVSCSYDGMYKSNTKYWCKGPVYEMCLIVAKTPKRRHTSGVSITDDREANVITVIMSSVQEGDEGMYWCVISRPGRNVFSGVRLVISNTVTTTTAAPSDPPPTSECSEVRWWQTLRWIFFTIMTACPMITYTAVWRINNIEKSRRRRQYLNATQ
ncbi:CMRF35-like molecule 2 isoform 1-T1 [Synchiropus picturatus]